MITVIAGLSRVNALGQPIKKAERNPGGNFGQNTGDTALISVDLSRRLPTEASFFRHGMAGIRGRNVCSHFGAVPLSLAPLSAKSRLPTTGPVHEMPSLQKPHLADPFLGLLKIA
jgi:hypothetical protein